MIKFDVHNIWTGAVQFTAEIDCAEDAPRSLKLGLALRWGIENGANLADANLAGANLARAYLAGAYLARANLAGANLAGANLAGAYLARAYLARAYLAGADLAGAIGNMRHIKSLQLDTWSVTYTADILQIGCQRHPITAWWEFSDEEIADMDDDALPWWRVWKQPLRTIIKLSPAEPTGYVPPPEPETAA